MRDELTRMRVRRNECGIVNLDGSQGPGTHWVAYFKYGNQSLYYDSFGDLKLPIEVEKYLSSSSIKYNYEAQQTYKSVNCGHLCLKFLIKTTEFLRKPSK